MSPDHPATRAMRRFSKKHSLVTLSDINITPLLDLAFVLLIIFIIAAPAMVENTMDLDLPQGGDAPQEMAKDDIRVIEINSGGRVFLDKKPMTPEAVGAALEQTFDENPNLIVLIRADTQGRVGPLYRVIDECRNRGIRRYSLATQAD